MHYVKYYYYYNYYCYILHAKISIYIVYTLHDIYNTKYVFGKDADAVNRKPLCSYAKYLRG